MKNFCNEYLNDMRHHAIAEQPLGESVEQAHIEQLGKAIYYVTRYAGIARKYGLLAVEEEAMSLDRNNPMEALLFEAVELLVDSCNILWMSEMLSNRYWLNNPKGYEATAEYICIRGILMIREGHNRLWVQRLATSILPVEIKENCMKISKEKEEQNRRKQNEVARIYFETNFSRNQEPMVRKSLEELEQELTHLTDKAIQCLLREVENNYLVQAMVGMCHSSRKKLARNMSYRLREMIMEDCYQLADIDSMAIAEGAVHVIEKLRVLEGCKDIAEEKYE